MSTRWSWLSFLVAALGLTTVFLVGNIAMTKRSQIQSMKSSSLAAMCTLDEETRLHLGEANNDLASPGESGEQNRGQVREECNYRDCRYGSACANQAQYSVNILSLD